jgi:hypothetical protein
MTDADRIWCRPEHAIYVAHMGLILSFRYLQKKHIAKISKIISMGS